MSVQVETDVFFRRLNAIYSSWNSGYTDSKSSWQGMDAFVTVLGKNSDDANEERTVALHVWLLGYEFSDFVMIFRKDKKLVFLGGEKKLTYLNGLKDAANQFGFELEFHVKGEDEENLKVFASATSGCAKVGDFEKEVHISALADLLAQHKSSLEIVSLNGALSVVMLVKDSKELEMMSKAATVSTLLQVQLRKKILDTLDEDARVSHREIANLITNLAEQPPQQFYERCKEKYGINLKDEFGAADFEVEFVTVQSNNGGFNLKNSAVSNKESLCVSDGNIVLSLGIKHREYHVAMARTLLVNPTSQRKALYEAVHAARARALERLSTGYTMEDVYQAVEDRVKANPEIQVSLEARVGHGIGIMFYDNETKMTAGNRLALEPHMTVYLSIVATSTTNANDCVWLADTVHVQEGNKSGVLLTDAKAAPVEVIFSIDDEADDDETKGEVKDERRDETVRRSAPTDQYSSTIRARPKNMVKSSSKQIEELQEQIKVAHFEKLKLRFANGELRDGGSIKKSIKKYDQLTAYKDSAEFPQDMKPNRIYVDDQREAVIVPINGRFVPFNAANIKNATFQQEDATRCVLRINFIVPTTLTAAQKANPEDNPLADTSALERPVYIKELLFKAVQGNALQLINKRINELARKVKAKQKQQQDEGEMAEDVTLQLNKTRARVALKDLMIAPSFGNQKKMVGTLEAHQNGFRYMASKVSESVDVPYQLIKHAFFQRATEAEPFVIIHFHLKHPILLAGKKKTDDVQFRILAGVSSEDVSQGRRDMNDAYEEQRERMLRQRLNQDFEKFVSEASKLAAAFDFTINFEEPNRVNSLQGCTGTSRTDIPLYPTSSALINIQESTFVLTFDTIDTVIFERVNVGTRNFDAVIIFKDYRKPVTVISLIPTERMEVLLGMLTDNEIPVFNSGQSLKWSNIMKSCFENDKAIEDFIEMGGFEGIFGDGSDAENSEEEEEDSDYVADESDDASEEDSDSDDSDISESEDDSEYADDDDDVSDWDEQAERLAEEDENLTDEEEADRRESRRNKSNAGRKPGRR